MKRLAILCVCIAACAPVIAAEQPPACLYSTVPLKSRAPVKDLSGELPIPDYLDAIIRCNTWAAQDAKQPRPPSAWLDSERALYQDALAKRPVDILIVPFQVQGFALDRIEQSLMTAELAYAIGDASEYRIADPFLTSRALGEGLRRNDPVEIDRLARKLGATKIIIGYVGHDRQHTFTLTLQMRSLSDPAHPGVLGVWQHDWRGIAFTDERTPAFVFNDMLPDLLHTLPLKLSTQHTRDTSPSAISQRVTQAPRDLVTSGTGNTAPVAAFDLFGALGSPESELSSEREFERALVASVRGGQLRSADDSFFRAYALTQLYRRPAALAALAGQTSAESVALVAILNGDLPSAQKAVAKVPQSLQRLLLDVGLRDLEAAYGHKLQTMPRASEQTFGAVRASWEPLVRLRAQADDGWSVPDPLMVKALLDLSHPVPEFDARSLLRGNAVTHAVALDEVEVDLANERHIRRAVTQIEPGECCRTPSLRLTQWDLLWLLEGATEARIAKSLWRQTTLQGLPEATLQQVSRYEPLLRGQPLLEMARSEAALRLYQKAGDDTRASWLAQAREGAAIAAYYMPGQNAIALGGLTTMGIPSPESQYLVDAYGFDYPRRPFWPFWFFGAGSDQERRTALALEALAFSINNVEPLKQLPRGDQPGHADAIIASLGRRFTGDPDRPEPSFDIEHSTPQEFMAHLRAAIKRNPEAWQNYEALGEYIVTSGGSYESARDTFLKFPGFSDRNPDDPVALSNYAFEAGSLLYWQGQTALAQPLYKIAADLDTGSDASLTSQARLLMMRGDYPGAAAIFLARASRYESPYAYRDYLSLLHAFGRSDDAWQGFSQIKASFLLPQAWVSALVGQERQGTRASDVRQWLLKPDIRDAKYRAFHFASYYAILWSSTDRKPEADLGKLVEQLDGPPASMIDSDGVTLLVPSNRDEKGFEMVRASPLRAGKNLRLPPNTRIKSELAYFADAYAAVRWGDYDTAVARFLAMADHYPIEDYPLAYFAYAAAKTGDKEGLEKYLESHGMESFDTWLALGFFAAARHDSEAALKALRSAFRLRPNSDFRPILSEYEYAQACEWLLQDTGDARFKEALLDWVRKHELIQPAQGWAYAMQYTYEKPGPERTRALAMTRYLSPTSNRIKSASKTEVDAAEAWFSENNPFRLQKPGTQRPEKTAMTRASERD
jgi:hypothetical protein